MKFLRCVDEVRDRKTRDSIPHTEVGSGHVGMLREKIPLHLHGFCRDAYVRGLLYCMVSTVRNWGI